MEGRIDWLSSLVHFHFPIRAQQPKKMQLLAFNYGQQVKGFSPIVPAVSLNVDCFESQSSCWWIWKIKASPPLLLHHPWAPPAGNPLSLWWCWKRARGTSILERHLRITSPSPILHPLDTNTTHLISPVHKDWPLEIWNLDSLHYLAIQRLIEGSCHLHDVIDILSTLMVVERVQPKDRIVLVFGKLLFKMLFSSWKSISLRFSKVCCDLLSTPLAVGVVGDPISPAHPTSLSLARKIIWAATTFSRPSVKTSCQIKLACSL